MTIDWTAFGDNALRMAVAYLLGLIIGFERERAERSAGIRTFPLVAVGSCAYVLIAAGMTGHSADSGSRVIQGVLTGIGFLGGGVIMRHGSTVRGTATAASIWNTGAIGVATALGHYGSAIFLTALNFAALRLLEPLKEMIQHDDDKTENRGNLSQR